MIKNIKWLEREYERGPYKCIMIRLKIRKHSLEWKLSKEREKLYYAPGREGYEKSQTHFLSLLE